MNILREFIEAYRNLFEMFKLNDEDKQRIYSAKREAYRKQNDSTMKGNDNA